MSPLRTRYLIPALTLALACVDGAERTPTNPRAAPNSQAVGVASAARVVTHDDMLEAVANIEPAFGGFYFRNNVLHVVLTDVTRSPVAVRRALTTVFSDQRLATAPLIVEKGVYGFAQLAVWGRFLPRVFSVSGVVSTDIDEVNSKLSIGVTTDAAIPAARALLMGLNVPRAAITFHADQIQVALQSSSASLGGEVRQILGGVHIDTNSPAIFCTLGLNVSFGGQASFMTDGHCSNSWGVPNDATNFWQAFRSVNADFAGLEGTESRTFGTATDSRCSGQYLCKWSDADFVPYAQSMVTQQSMGYFARTTTRTPLDSNLVINSSNPTIPITSKTLFPFVGDVVDKVGARTGWTYGAVTEACVTKLVRDLSGQIMEMVCVDVVSAGAGRGDSGAGVFVYDQSTGNASWAGQLISGGSFNGLVYTNYLFAPLNNIQAEFGNVPATIYGQ